MTEQKKNTHSINPITGDRLVSRASTDTYRENYDKIFGKSNLEKKLEEELRKSREYMENYREKETGLRDVLFTIKLS